MDKIDIRYAQIVERIKSLRESQNISKRDMAEKVGVSEKTYYLIESGASKLDVPKLMRLVDALGTTMYELLTGEPEPAKQDGGLVAYNPANIAETLATISQDISYLKRKFEEDDER